MTDKVSISYWWWIMFWSLVNLFIFLFDLATDNVMWITWFNGAAAIWLANRAGSYPISESKTKCSKE